MVLNALLATTVLSLCPQGEAEPQELPTQLSKSELKSLNQKAAKWLESELEYDDSKGKAREKAAKNMRKYREDFMNDFEKKGSKIEGGLLASVGDLSKVFANTFPYGKESGRGQLKQGKRDGFEWFYSAPRSYKPADAVTTVVVLPARKDSKWESARDRFKSTWEDSDALGNLFFHFPVIEDSLELDPTPDFNQPGAADTENKRIGAIFASFGDSMRTFRIDRSKTFLDAGAGNSAFALRLATYFPDRFAGLILRQPSEVDETLRLGSLTGLPVLLVSSANTADAANALKKRLDALEEGACEILEGAGDAPFKESAAGITEWITRTSRKLYRSTVVLEPNHNLFRRGFWVEIGTMEALEGVADADRPKLVVTADREKNRVTVDATSIETFVLRLNDALVDLNKEFTIVINGKAVAMKRDRNFEVMLEPMLTKYDTNYLFPVVFEGAVPKGGDEAGEK